MFSTMTERQGSFWKYLNLEVQEVCEDDVLQVLCVQHVCRVGCKVSECCQSLKLPLVIFENRVLQTSSVEFMKAVTRKGDVFVWFSFRSKPLGRSRTVAGAADHTFLLAKIYM
jgi:hypothetical protein